MVRVIRQRRYRVHVYAEEGQRRHSPHCHVYWPDGDGSVALDDFRVLDGEPLSSQARELLEKHRDDLWRPWFRLNGGDSTT